jgi:hypothetical protein
MSKIVPLNTKPDRRVVPGILSLIATDMGLREGGDLKLEA